MAVPHTGGGQLRNDRVVFPQDAQPVLDGSLAQTGQEEECEGPAAAGSVGEPHQSSRTVRAVIPKLGRSAFVFNVSLCWILV